MSLPVYFVSQGQAAPENGKYAAPGWHCAPDGTLIAPEIHRRADALVFDDRIPLPDRIDDLTDALLRAAERLWAAVIVLDFERPTSPGACRFAQCLSARYRTAAPVRFCAGSCEPIFCYAPSAQTFPDFSGHARGWLELRPVQETIRYAADGPLPPGDGTAQFSELLQCRYRARAGESALVLELFDTPETFRARFELLKDRFTAAIGLWNELNAFDLTNE